MDRKKINASRIHLRNHGFQWVSRRTYRHPLTGECYRIGKDGKIRNAPLEMRGDPTSVFEIKGAARFATSLK